MTKRPGQLSVREAVNLTITETQATGLACVRE